MLSFLLFYFPSTSNWWLPELDAVGVLPVKTRGNLVLVHKGSLGLSQIFYGLYLTKCLEVAAKINKM